MNNDAQLTPREKEMMRLVIKGLGNKAIAKRMSITENTVESYLKDIFLKLEVHNRTEAVCKCLHLEKNNF